MRVKHLRWIKQSGKRICIGRFYLMDDLAKLSVSIMWEPRDLWIGIYWDKKDTSTFVYVCLLPCLPIRIHWKRSYSGKFA